MPSHSQLPLCIRRDTFVARISLYIFAQKELMGTSPITTPTGRARANFTWDQMDQRALGEVRHGSWGLVIRPIII